MASRPWASDRRYSFQQEVVDLFAEVTFTTSTNAATLSTANSLGVRAIVQAKPSVAIAAGGGLYVLSLSDRYSKCLNLTAHNFEAPGAVNGVQRVLSGTAGGVGTVVFTSVAAANTVTIGGTVFTAIANGGTAGNNEFVIGTGGTLDTAAATNLAAAINGSTTAGIAGVVSARAVGTAVAIATSAAGMGLSSNEATKVICVTDGISTVNVPKEMRPGLVLQTVAGATPTVPGACSLALALTLRNSAA